MRKNFRHREQAGQRPRAVANKNLKRANVSGIYRVEDDGHFLHSLDWKKSLFLSEKNCSWWDLAMLNQVTVDQCSTRPFL